jgi:hypothetical protein
VYLTETGLQEVQLTFGGCELSWVRLKGLTRFVGIPCQSWPQMHWYLRE